MKPSKRTKRLAFMWLVLLGLFCLVGALCRSESAVPTEVEIQWPDAAPHEIGDQPAKPAKPAPAKSP